MPTSDEESRTEASWTDFEVKFYVGPKRDMVQADNVQAGYDFTPSTTIISADVNNASTTIEGLDFLPFTLGAVIIEPYGDSDEYEFIKYGSSTMYELSDLTRYQQDDLQTTGGKVWGVHATGATVSEIVEITAKVLDVSLDYDERGGAAIWTAKLSGWNYDSILLDNDNMFIGFIRQRPASGSMASWTDWKVWFVGYIKQCTITDDGGQGREWKGVVEGLSQYMESDDNPRHYGRKDLAEGATITVSSYLDDPWQERASGEYTGFPSLDGDQLNDGELSTLWISEGEPDSTQEEALDVHGLCINEILLRPRQGYVTRDAQWIELFWKRDDGKSEKLKRFVLTNSQTTWESVSWSGDPEEELLQNTRARIPVTNFVNLGSGAGPLGPGGGFGILTFNKAKFLERYPHHQADHVLDMRPFIVGEFSIDLTGDFLGLLLFAHVPTDIIWMDNGRADWNLYAWCGSDDGGGTQYSDWTGVMVDISTTAVPLGHTIKKTPCGKTSQMSGSNVPNATFWTTSSHPTPGYHISGEPEWAQVDLGEMGITLESTLEANEENEILLAKAPVGLPAGGTVLIDAELINYSSRDDNDNKLMISVNGRGVGGTSAVEHPADSTVLAYEDGVSYSCYKVSAVSWRRKAVLGSEGPDTLKNFDVYTSTYIDPVQRDSEDWDNAIGMGGWQDYWEITSTVRNNRQTHWVGSFSPKRVRHVLIVINDMTYNGRVKLNQIHVWSDQVDLAEVVSEDEDAAITAVVDGMWSGYIIQDIISRTTNLQDDSFTMEEEGRPILELQTTGGSTMQTLRDICRRTGCSVVFNLDETVTHRYNPLFPLAGLDTLEYEWNRENTIDVRLVRPFRHNVSQVVLKAHDPRTEETWEAIYPPEALALGAKISKEDWIFTSPDEAGLMAEYVFRQNNAPLSIVLEPVGPAEWVRPGMRCTVDWIMDDSGAYVRKRNFVVMGVAWRLKFGKGGPGQKMWTTTVKMTELIF